MVNQRFELPTHLGLIFVSAAAGCATAAPRGPWADAPVELAGKLIGGGWEQTLPALSSLASRVFRLV
jgi:hypothetical protein